MKVGEIVETLIYLRDSHGLTAMEDDAVCSACNILDRMPAMMEAAEAEMMARTAPRN